MGTATTRLVSAGGIGGSAASPIRPDNASPVGGASQMQGGHASAAASAQTPLKVALCSIVGSTSYATGGDTVDWTRTGFDSIIAVIPLGIVNTLAASLRCLEYDHDNSKAMIRQSGGSGAIMSQVTAATDQSGCSFRCLVIGT